MSSGQGRKGSATGLKAIALTGLLLLLGSTSASLIEHSNHQVIAEPRLINIPNSLLGHRPHGSHGHRHRARLPQKRAEPVVVVGVPYTIWTGTFEDLKRRAPALKDDNTKTGNTSTDGSCTTTCPKGYYCTDAGCCPNGKKCTGIPTCLDATDSECPDNIACCPKGNPVCQVSRDQGICMKQKHEDPTTTSNPTTTSDPPKTTSNKVTKADVTTTSESKTPETTSTHETSTSETTQTSVADQAPTTPPLAIPTIATDSGVSTPVWSPSATSTAPTPSATAITTDLSSSTKIISGAVAGSIVALAFGSLIIYTIVKKRRENALARAEEESKAGPMSAPVTAAPMGSGGNGRPLSIQPEPEMLHMGPQAPTAVFTSGPQQGKSLRKGIPPPSPPPNPMVVGTPPYRRGQQSRASASLRAAAPGPQIAQQWSPAEGYHGEAYPVEGGYPAQQGYDQNYPPNFPFPEETYDAGYHGPGQAYSPAVGSYQAYSPPSTPRYPPGTAYSPH